MGEWISGRRKGSREEIEVGEKMEVVKGMNDGRRFPIRRSCGFGWYMVFWVQLDWISRKEFVKKCKGSKLGERFFGVESDEDVEGGEERWGVMFNVTNFSIGKVMSSAGGERMEDPENVHLIEWTMDVVSFVGKEELEVGNYWPYERNQFVRVEGERGTEDEYRVGFDINQEPGLNAEVGRTRNNTTQKNTGYQLFDTSAAGGHERGRVQFHWSSVAYNRPEAKSQYNVDTNMAKYLIDDEFPSPITVQLEGGDTIGAFFESPYKNAKLIQFQVGIGGKFRKPISLMRHKGAQKMKDVPFKKYKLIKERKDTHLTKATEAIGKSKSF